MCEYHPSSKIPPEVHAFHDFKRHSTPLASSALPNKHPWAPFKSQLEFEFAELALEACLNNKQTIRLIKLCNQCTFRQEKFTFQTHKDIYDRWDTASYRITGVVSVFLSNVQLPMILKFSLLKTWSQHHMTVQYESLICIIGISVSGLPTSFMILGSFHTWYLMRNNSQSLTARNS